MKRIIGITLIALTILPGCSSMSNAGKGALIGTGAGAALGTAVGALIGGQKGAGIGAAIGTAVGAGSGAVIGDVMDRKAKELAELEALENAKIETVTDNNGLEAIKVTFDSGILFNTNSSTLSAASKEALSAFAGEMQDLPDTDITVYGHTDNTGTAEVNERISKQRAEAVSKHLQTKGIAATRIITEGKSFNEPVADNATAEGRAQNRRVEVFITAGEKMVEAANNGELK